jgi:hypothetical protein
MSSGDNLTSLPNLIAAAAFSTYVTPTAPGYPLASNV